MKRMLPLIIGISLIAPYSSMQATVNTEEIPVNAALQVLTGAAIKAIWGPAQSAANYLVDNGKQGTIYALDKALEVLKSKDPSVIGAGLRNSLAGVIFVGSAYLGYQYVAKPILQKFLQDKKNKH
jgi:hypothetical protein